MDERTDLPLLRKAFDAQAAEIKRLRTMVQVSLYPQNIGISHDRAEKAEARAEVAEARVAALEAGLRGLLPDDPGCCTCQELWNCFFCNSEELVENAIEADEIIHADGCPWIVASALLGGAASPDTGTAS